MIIFQLVSLIHTAFGSIVVIQCSIYSFLVMQSSGLAVFNSFVIFTGAIVISSSLVNVHVNKLCEVTPSPWTYSHTEKDNILTKDFASIWCETLNSKYIDS